MHVVVTGSRGWTDLALIRAVAYALPRRSTVIVGGARGVDQAFEGEARVLGHTVIVDRANWRPQGYEGDYNPAAGFERNLKMLDRLAHLPNDERCVIAFWLGKSPGTRHTIVNAMKRGYPLNLHWRPDGQAS